MNIRNASPIEQAALTWWKSHRPLSFSEQDHRDNPTINLSTDCDGAIDLAKAVVEVLRTRGEGDLEPSRAVTRQEVVKVLKGTRKSNVKA